MAPEQIHSQPISVNNKVLLEQSHALHLCIIYGFSEQRQRWVQKPHGSQSLFPLWPIKKNKKFTDPHFKKIPPAAMWKSDCMKVRWEAGRPRVNGYDYILE